MVLRDLTLSGRLPPFKQLTYVTGGIVYPIGGQIHRWLADTYGDWRAAPHVQGAQPPRELRGRHPGHLRPHARPAQRRVPARHAARSSTRRSTAWPRCRCSGPRSSGSRVKPAFLADTGPIRRPDRPGEMRLRVAGQRLCLDLPQVGWRRARGTPQDRHRRPDGRDRVVPSRSIPAWMRRGPGLLLFTARYGDRDALFVWDLKRAEDRGPIPVPGAGLDALSPLDAGSARASSSAASRERGVSDLYRVRLPGGELEPLTNDRYQDLDPSPSADGAPVVFASDRTAGGRGRRRESVPARPRHRQPSTQLTPGDWRDESPSVGGRRPHLFHLRPRRRAQRLLRRFRRARAAARPPPGPAPSTPSRCPRGGLAGRRIPRPELEPLPAIRSTPPRTGSASRGYPTRRPRAVGLGDPGDTATGIAARREPYRRRLTLDFAAGDAVLIPGYGGAQGIAFVASDLLGDNLLLRLASSSYQGRRLGSILSNLNATAIYLNQSRRVNWGLGAFRTKSRNFEGDRVVAYDETAVRRASACCAIRSRASPGSRPPSSSSTPTAWTSRSRSTSLAGSAGSRPTT